MVADDGFRFDHSDPFDPFDPFDLRPVVRLAWPVIALRAACLAAVALVLFLAGAAPHAQEQTPAPQPDTRALDPYVGVVTDGTVTIFGQEFYRSFTAAWREQPRIDRYSLAVFERPSARWGSLVWVEYANRRVFSAFLSPSRREQIRAAGRDAAQIAYRNVVVSEVERLLIKDPDLAREEL